MQRLSNLSKDGTTGVPTAGFLTTRRFPGLRGGGGGGGRGPAPGPERTTSPRMPCDGSVGAGPCEHKAVISWY